MACDCATDQAIEPAETSVWHVRAAAWELAALSLRCPSSELVEAVATGEWYEAAREILAALGADADCVCGGACSSEAAESGEVDREALFHELRAEYTRLFVGVRRPPVSPYEGIWAAEDVGVDPLLFVNPKSLDVEHFCHDCGLGQPEGTNEPLDNVATECELMQYLALLAGGLAMSPEGGPVPCAFPGGSPEAAYALFAEKHVRTWMPRFAQKAAEETRLPFYRAAAALLTATVERAL